jgi:peptidoglycan/xylan/chitin deacetylase (PgdA/CDA1 family)
VKLRRIRLEHTREQLRAHLKRDCAGTCCLHRRTDHAMRAYPQHWRDDRRLMERVCSHGVGHPDPDHMAYVQRVRLDAEFEGEHGCCGEVCCA